MSAGTGIRGRLTVVASGMPRHRDQAAIRIRNRYAALHVARLEPGQSVTVPDAPFAHVYLARGRLHPKAEGPLNAGDAARLTAAGQRRLDAAPAPAPPMVMNPGVHLVTGRWIPGFTW